MLPPVIASSPVSASASSALGLAQAKKVAVEAANAQVRMSRLVIVNLIDMAGSVTSSSRG